MRLIEIKNKKQFNNFLTNQKHSQFLQSWEWGEFQKKIGNDIFRFGILDNERLIFVITLIKKKLPFINKYYFYAPRIGIKFLDRIYLEFLFSEIKKIGIKKNIIFISF